MYQLKRIVVSLDLTNLDEEVVRYTSVMAEIMDADTIYFLHVAASLELPDSLSEEYRSALAPVDETIKHETQATVDKYFSVARHHRHLRGRAGRQTYRDGAQVRQA